MPYNNGFPIGYQPSQLYFPQVQQPIQPAVPQQNTAPTPAPTNNRIIWVQGEAGAKSYLVAPNNTVDLWDSEAQVIYLKSADASGMPSMKVLDYTVRDNTPKTAPVSVSNEYATKNEVSALESQIKAIMEQIDALSVKRTVKKEAVKDD